MKNHPKTILITGASKGIGKAIVERLGISGNDPKNHLYHDFILTARSKDVIQELAKKIEEIGGRAIAIPCDVKNEEEIQSVVEKGLKTFGKIDVLINNAGIGKFKRVDEFTSQEFMEILQVNLMAPFLFTKYVVPSMIKQRAGQIINISSVAGLNGFKTGTAYAASKFGLNGFTESLREDLKEYGIAVSVICPGGVRTGFGGMDENAIKDFLLEPDDVAYTVEYLIHESETANTKLIELKPRRRKEFRG
ncbi:MAG: SDR family oxidoreductase [Leptospiraceae bacterium]|jgi:3-oxoacyl-[acyl-carrier protein] reductase|nr:SDR family oxidoreductase [Leptospiraceae bacterium]